MVDDAATFFARLFLQQVLERRQHDRAVRSDDQTDNQAALSR